LFIFRIDTGEDNLLFNKWIIFNTATRDKRKVSGRVQGVSILPVTTIFVLDFGTVPTVVFFVFYLDGSHIIQLY
jgi:hypothetical protein